MLANDGKITYVQNEYTYRMANYSGAIAGIIHTQ